MDRAKVKLLREVCQAALEEVAAKNKLVISVGSGSFDNHSVRFKLEVGEIGASGETPDQRDFNSYCNLFGLRPEDYGVMFTYGGRQFKLIEICPRRPKFPFVGECLRTGKKFKFGMEIARLIRPANGGLEGN